MKSIKKIVSTLVLGMTLFAFPVLACGDMTAGSKCLVQTIPTTTVTKDEKKGLFGFDTEVFEFLGGFFGKIFG